MSAITASADALSLDSCRRLAIKGNKDIKRAAEEISIANDRKKEARAALLPALDLTATYLYNQKNISMLAEDALLPVKDFSLEKGGYEYNLVMNPITGQPLIIDGSPVPQQVAMLPKDALTFDMHNVFAGAVTLTQPVYMGGKIIALNKIAGLSKDLAENLHSQKIKDVIYNVDVAYWQVVSLSEKQRLANSYVNLLDTLSANVHAMFDQGVATKADVLAVDVKLNEANVDKTKVENGLVLSRMLLAQICGLPTDTEMELEDEARHNAVMPDADTFKIDINEVYAKRNDVQSLETAVKIFEQKEKIARSTMLPNLAVVGSYSMTNPNIFNGFSKRFSGMFSVGAMLTVPLWHWGGNYAKYRAAKSETVIQRLTLDDTREKIQLQVSQANFRRHEAFKTYEATRSNLAKADENLRQATLAFHEGILPSENVMAAQTAWLKANSEHIDAEIDLRLCQVYLEKVTGSLKY